MKSHRFDGISFAAGLIITLIGLVFLIPTDVSDIVGALTDLGGWFWPLLFVAIGVAVLVPLFVPKRGEEKIDAESDDSDL